MSLPISDAVLSVAEMRTAEQAAVAAGVSEWDLMRCAGEGAAQYVLRMAAGRPVTVLCGPGNNGGDGYVIAQAVIAAGGKATVIAPEPPRTPVAEQARAAFHGATDNEGLCAGSVVVDCLFGYGLSREIEGEYADLLDRVSRHDGMRIAIDLPSGVASDSGALLGTVPAFDATLALGAWKRAHFSMPARERMGAVRLVPIGLDVDGHTERVSRRPVLQAPSARAHKYTRGLLAIVAGAMPGAPLLAAEAAMRAGAGYIKLLSDHTHPAAPADLVIDSSLLDKALSDERIDACLVGPGLGRGDEARARMSAVLEESAFAVIDADALHLLNPDSLEGCDAARLVVTPHEGELATLCKAFGVAKGGKRERAIGLHHATGLTVLAKGADTILAGSEGVRYFHPASPWLSSAGTGDVLAGILASRLAHVKDPFVAAQEAVWLHGEAARIAGAAFTAGDLARAVGQAMASFIRP